jgi:flagellar biosynthesis protein FlhB
LERSVALKYDRELPAPFIVASGKGELARRIRQIAEEAGVSIVERPELAEALIELGPGDFIPEEFYAIIAELLVFVRGIRTS